MRAGLQASYLEYLLLFGLVQARDGAVGDFDHVVVAAQELSLCPLLSVLGGPRWPSFPEIELKAQAVSNLIERHWYPMESPGEEMTVGCQYFRIVSGLGG
jgi:hypothetical protein